MLIAQIAVYLATMPRLIPLGFDAWSYFAAGRAIVASVDPYQADLRPLVPEGATIVRMYLTGHPYLYPPLVAIALMPLHAMHVTQAMVIWLGVVMALTVLLALALQPLVGPRVAWIAVFMAFPTWESWYNGQINALIALCVTIAISDATRGYARRGAAALVLGTLVKITPVIGLALLVLRRPRQVVPVSLAVGAGVIAATLSIVDVKTWIDGALISLQAERYSAHMVSWGPLLHDLPGLAGRAAPLAVMAGLTLITILRAPSIQLSAALAACSLIPLLSAPIVWSHYTIMALPALAVIWGQQVIGQRLAVSTWLVMSLPPAYPLLLVVLPLCWVELCWPGQIEGWLRRAGWRDSEHLP